MAPKTNTPPDPAARAAAAAGEQDEPKQVTVAELPDTLAAVDSADEVRAMKAADDRSTAQPIYDARIEELEKGNEPAADAKPEARPAGKAPRKARKRVKYQGTWYAPGETVPFASKKDAEPYDADRALEPAK